MDAVFELVVRWLPVVVGLLVGLPLLARGVGTWFVPQTRASIKEKWLEGHPNRPLTRQQGAVVAASLCVIGTAQALFYGTIAALLARFAFIAGAWLGKAAGMAFACAWGFGPCGGA